MRYEMIANVIIGCLLGLVLIVFFALRFSMKTQDFDNWLIMSESISVGFCVAVFICLSTGFILYLFTENNLFDSMQPTHWSNELAPASSESPVSAVGSLSTPRAAIGLDYVLKHDETFRLFMIHLFKGM